MRQPVITHGAIVALDISVLLRLARLDKFQLDSALTATKLAHEISVRPNRVLSIIHGNRNITADTAQRLGRFFGTRPELWMNLQKAYDLDRVKVEMGKTIENIQPWTPPEVYVSHR